jgi:hypothetical protein
MSYLVCEKCGRYYELQQDENHDDFESCWCDGNLIYFKNLDRYIKKPSESNIYNESFFKNKKSKKKKFLLFSVLVIFIFLFTIILEPNNSVLTSHFSGANSNFLGVDSRGYVTKNVYTAPFPVSGEKKVIAIVTGIHPREKLSKSVVNNVINEYPLSSNEEIVHYDIKVISNPENFFKGRTNGEGLAAQYILPDILKSQDDLVIICHDHEIGYGEGFFIATPRMDEKSVELARNVKHSLSNFSYYLSKPHTRHGSSTMIFSWPLASAGYKTFVYEIPENVNYWDGYINSHNLISTSFQKIGS